MQSQIWQLVGEYSSYIVTYDDLIIGEIRESGRRGTKQIMKTKHTETGDEEIFSRFDTMVMAWEWIERKEKETNHFMKQKRV